MGKVKHRISLTLKEGALKDPNFTDKYMNALNEFKCWYSMHYNVPMSVDYRLIELETGHTIRLILKLEQDVDLSILRNIRNKLKEVFRKHGLYA